MITFVITENIAAREKMWLVGDNYLAGTYRLYVKNASDDNLFIKQHFDVTPVGSNKYNDKNQNILSRLQISLAKAFNDNTYMPEYLVVVLEDDLINYLGYTNYGISTMYGEWVEWLAKEFNDLVFAKSQSLPAKAKSNQDPMIYWVTLPKSNNYSKELATARSKFNLSLESVVHQYQNMRSVKLKEFWSPDNDNVVWNDKLTSYGQSIYWKAVDATIQFNIEKRNAFIIKKNYMNAEQKLKGGAKTQMKKMKDLRIVQGNNTEEKEDNNRRVQQMFCRKRAADDGENFRRGQARGDKFLLPKYRRY